MTIGVLVYSKPCNWREIRKNNVSVQKTGFSRIIKVQYRIFPVKWGGKITMGRQSMTWSIISPISQTARIVSAVSFVMVEYGLAVEQEALLESPV